MLAIAPDVIDLRKAQVARQYVRDSGDGPLDPPDPHSRNYAPSGRYGDPTSASEAKGKLILDAIMRHFRDILSYSQI